jgi:hypothetical protein
MFVNAAACGNEVIFTPGFIGLIFGVKVVVSETIPENAIVFHGELTTITKYNIGGNTND